MDGSGGAGSLGVYRLCLSTMQIIYSSLICQVLCVTAHVTENLGSWFDDISYSSAVGGYHVRTYP